MLRDLCDNIKHANLCMIGIPEGKEEEKGIENIFDEIMAKTFQISRILYQGTGSTEGPKQVEPKIDPNEDTS